MQLMAGESAQQGARKADEQEKEKEKEKKGEKAGKKAGAERGLSACLDIGIGELFCSLIKGMILILLAS
ncbi:MULTISPECIES: hypothetical protein [Cobetia]|uniref:hypothetical protein n=1 Tax=Cobetia TaxID=204286 RepID=UPI0015836454|nr:MULTISPECIES: hypothetical protein [Cobetia]MDI4659993.1 hypothetical protein [Cobetia sp. BMC6]NUJ55400.1 hypothetical protein [Cobetia marina]